MLERLTFLLPGFPADESDTSCLPAVQTYVRAYARRHPDVLVQVLAFQYPSARGSYCWHGIPVFSAGGGNRRGMLKLRTWARVWHRARGALPSLLHSFWIGECPLVGELLARWHDLPHVATVGGQELRERTLYARALATGRFTLTAASPAAADTARRGLGREVDAVVPLGLDPSDLCTERPDRDIDVLAVGSLIPLKQFDHVLDVAARFPMLRFRVVGDGPERRRLECRATPNVRLSGSLPREEVLRLMRRSRILLHPSEYESQGYVFLEALASGMHVVCRDTGAPGRSARVHRCENVEAMQDTVGILAARELDASAVPVVTVDDTITSYDEIYRTILGETSQRS